MGRLFREDFDWERSFVALKAFLFNARGYVPGQVIDKGQFTVRRLRQLYDMRSVGYLTEKPATVVSSKYANGEPVIKLLEAQPIGGGIPRRRMRVKPEGELVSERSAGSGS